MRQHKIVEEYLNSVIPDDISEGSGAELRAELESHIYDKAEFYMEIGYEEEVAFEKAVNEMGETEPVKTEFMSIYSDSTFKAFALFFVMCTVNILSVSSFNLGYWYFVEPSMHVVPCILELIAFLAGFVFFTVHTIKCSRYKLHKQLTGMTAAYGLMFLASFITSGLFYPVFNAASLVYRFITNSPEPEKDIGFGINIVALFIYALFSFISLLKDRVFRKKPYRFSLKQITVALSLVSVCFLIVYGFAYAKYEYDFFESGERSEKYYLSNITCEQRNSYAAVEDGFSEAETEKLLTGNGFIRQTVSFDELLDFWMLPYWIDDYLYEKKYKYINDNHYAIYCYTNGMEDEEDYDDIISCVVVSFDKTGKVDYKLFIPDLGNLSFNGCYLSYSHGEATQKWLDKLQPGDSTETEFEFIRNTDACIIEDEKYSAGITRSTYRVDLWCYYPLDITFVEFLFGSPPDDVQHSYEFIIEAENSMITDIKHLEN